MDDSIPILFFLSFSIKSLEIYQSPRICETMKTNRLDYIFICSLLIIFFLGVFPLFTNFAQALKGQLSHESAPKLEEPWLDKGTDPSSYQGSKHLPGTMPWEEITPYPAP